ncbi:MAG TPA: hypothetical protein VIX89_16940 [Bryobacteraceae bacterium]
MFDLIEQAIRSGGPEAGLSLLVQKLEEEKNYPLLFEARMMQKRHALGLPLLQMDVPEDKRAAYEQAFSDAARETGSLFLAGGEISRAWPYFRAIGDGAPVAAAIEKLDAQHQELDRIIEIALEERVNPRKGFELMLAHYGICRAITYFEQYPDPKSREECIALLVRTLHHELVENLGRAIAQREGNAPDTQNIPALIAGRGWLFGDMDYYADTSHVISVIRFGLDLQDPETLRLALEICEYGGHLSPQFKYRVDPPFENVYPDHALYIHALLGENVDAAIDHFRAGPPQVHVALLVRLKRYREAIEFSIEHLSEVPPDQLACPSVLQLCQLAGDYDLLRKLARDRGDLLSFVAANFRP